MSALAGDERPGGFLPTAMRRSRGAAVVVLAEPTWPRRHTRPMRLAILRKVDVTLRSF